MARSFSVLPTFTVLHLQQVTPQTARFLNALSQCTCTQQAKQYILAFFIVAGILSKRKGWNKRA